MWESYEMLFLNIMGRDVRKVPSFHTIKFDQFQQAYIMLS